MTKEIFKNVLLLGIFLGITISSTSQKRIDILFQMWNKKTFESLERQKDESNDSISRNSYRNSLLAFKNFQGIKSENEINSRATRYEFLKEVINSNKENYFIIESDLNSYTYILRTFVVYFDSTQKMIVNLYLHKKSGWYKAETCVKDTGIVFDEDLVKYHLPSKGGNDNHIIVTRVQNGSIVQVEYFMPFKLSQHFPTEIIFSCKRRIK